MSGDIFFAPDRRPLSRYDIDAIVWMAEDQRPLTEIAGAIGRSVGTISGTIARLRPCGAIQTIGRRRTPE